MSFNLFSDFIGKENSNTLYKLVSDRHKENSINHLLIILNAFKTNAFDIQRKIQSNELTLEQLAEMTDEDINEEYYAALKKKKSEHYQKELNGNTPQATTDLFECRKCKKRECVYYELQTRSADEPMTKFIKCCNCGFQWRQN